MICFRVKNEFQNEVFVVCSFKIALLSKNSLIYLAIRIECCMMIRTDCYKKENNIAILFIAV